MIVEDNVRVDADMLQADVSAVADNDMLQQVYPFNNQANDFGEGLLNVMAAYLSDEEIAEEDSTTNSVDSGPLGDEDSNMLADDGLARPLLLFPRVCSP